MLKLELFRYGTLVFGKVLEQNVPDGGTTLLISDDTCDVVKSICSSASPELEEDNLFVRGWHTGKDNAVFSYNYNTEEDARKAIVDIQYLVTKHNLKSSNTTNKSVLEPYVAG